MFCDDEATEAAISDMTLAEGTECGWNVEMTSAEACPVYSVPELTEWLEQFKYLWGAVFICVGIFMCIWGRKIF
jgi:hypothetical protein